MNKFENQKCLLVDDFSTARRIIKTTLQEIGFSCHEAENGKQAISLIKQTTFDLVIADINMPEMNGLELLKDIRSDDNMKDLIVVLSLLEPWQFCLDCPCYKPPEVPRSHQIHQPS